MSRLFRSGVGGLGYCDQVLESFHPAVRTWFARRFPDGPTEPQASGWAEIAADRHTLIAAPTGSGKTLAAFLVCIDRIYRSHDQQEAADGSRGPGPQVVYVSPLKALAVDIWQNLERPLAEIAQTAAELGMTAPLISVAVRTGDTAAAERAAMLKKPPDFLITTPESLYLLLTAERPRAMLRAVRTVIVDEIHAVAGNKRGSHLALTLERLAHVAADPVQRIGLSATQRPIEAVARLLVGAGQDRSDADGAPLCSIVDAGHRRELDLGLELPDDELGAVATAGQMAEILDLIAGHVTGHRTTLVFVNTRRMAERVAHELGERLGDGRSPRTTGACPRTAGSASRPGFVLATCGRWWRPPRWSSASTSGRSSWSARSARPAASPPSFSESAGPTTPRTAYLPAGCIQRAGMS